MGTRSKYIDVCRREFWLDENYVMRQIAGLPSSGVEGVSEFTDSGILFSKTGIKIIPVQVTPSRCTIMLP